MKEVVYQKSHHFTLALASLAASASAAMARWRFSGNRASLLQEKCQLQHGEKCNEKLTLSIKMRECLTFLLFPLLFPSLQSPRPASSIKNYLFWLMIINCCVGDNLHGARNTVSVTENLVKILGSQNISERCLCEQSGKWSSHKKFKDILQKPTLCCDECPSHLSHSRWRWTRGSRPRRPLTPSRCPLSAAAKGIRWGEVKLAAN